MEKKCEGSVLAMNYKGQSLVFIVGCPRSGTTWLQRLLSCHPQIRTGQAKMMEARVSQELETKQQGERFTLVESATLPDKPFKPNRLAIILIGIVLGIGAGVGFASIIEFSDTSFRDAESLHRATGFPVLTVVPKIITSQDRTRRFMKRIILSVTVITSVVVLIVLFNNYVMDLNVVWAKIMRKF